MKLKKKDRERLYKAKGAAVELTWPEDAPEPHKGHRYAVYGSEPTKLFSVRVERSKRLSYEIKVWAKIDDDPFRPMIGIEGVRLEDGAYETEPERVSEEYEKILCIEATYRNRLLRAERTGSGRLAMEYAAREQKRLESV